MTFQHVFDHFVKQLTPLYDKGEAESITSLIFREKLGIDKIQMMLKSQQVISEVKANELAYSLVKLMKGVPVQYVLGHAWFYGLKLKVNRHVLIPRPETEELVDLIIHDYHDDLPIRILDVGTGSGCIAIAIKKNLPRATVSAVDISEDALRVAQGNAGLQGVDIATGLFDVLNFESQAIHQWFEALHSNHQGKAKFDIIVSNPPYIPVSESGNMHRNVIGFEPHLALFVPDNDPLVFYKALVLLANQCLSERGKLYLEIHESYAGGVVELFNQHGYSNNKVINDLHGKQRMFIAMR